MRKDFKLMSTYWFFKPDYSLRTNLMAFGWECGKGWHPLIIELCDKLKELIETKYPEFMKIDEWGYPGFFVTQVKEKFGTLSFYVSGANDEILDLIDEYEGKSTTICEYCGKDGELREKNHWLATLCTDCNEKWQNNVPLWSLNE